MKPSRMSRRDETRRPPTGSRPGPRGAATAVGMIASTISSVVARAIAKAAMIEVRGDPAGTSAIAATTARAAAGRVSQQAFRRRRSDDLGRRGAPAA